MRPSCPPRPHPPCPPLAAARLLTHASPHSRFATARASPPSLSFPPFCAPPSPLPLAPVPSKVMKEDDNNWPEPDRVGRQELEVVIGNEHIHFTTTKLGSVLQARPTPLPTGRGRAKGEGGTGTVERKKGGEGVTGLRPLGPLPSFRRDKTCALRFLAAAAYLSFRCQLLRPFASPRLRSRACPFLPRVVICHCCTLTTHQPP